MKKFLLSLAAMACLVPAFSKTDLSKYVIVYPAAAEAEEGAEIAAAVAAEVALQTGVQIPVVTDETPAVKKEILIGRTNRPESAAFYAGKPDTCDWFLGVKGSGSARASRKSPSRATSTANASSSGRKAPISASSTTTSGITARMSIPPNGRSSGPIARTMSVPGACWRSSGPSCRTS